MFHYKQFMEEHFQTPTGVVAFLAAYGRTDVSVATVEKWFLRNSIPSGWFAVLLALLELETGAPKSIARYLMETV